jgi:hypothetical protein
MLSRSTLSQIRGKMVRIWILSVVSCIAQSVQKRPRGRQKETEFVDHIEGVCAPLKNGESRAGPLTDVGR